MLRLLARGSLALSRRTLDNPIVSGAAKRRRPLDGERALRFADQVLVERQRRVKRGRCPFEDWIAIVVAPAGCLQRRCGRLRTSAFVSQLLHHWHSQQFENVEEAACSGTSAGSTVVADTDREHRAAFDFVHPDAICREVYGEVGHSAVKRRRDLQTDVGCGIGAKRASEPRQEDRELELRFDDGLQQRCEG